MAVIKIILLILLGIFLLITALLVLAMFLPFTYTVKGKGDGDFRIKVNLHGFLYFVNLTLRMKVGGEKEPMRGALRLFGIPVLRIPKKEKKRRGKKEPPPEEEPENTEEKPEETPETEEKPKEAPKTEEGSEAEGLEGTEAPEEEPPPKKKSILEKGKSLIQTLTDEGNKAAVKKIMAEAKKILKILFPKRLKTNLTFSTGDPANTGKAIGILSLVPMIYQRGNRIIPDFEAEKAYLSGTFSVRGRFILITIVIPAVRLLLDKNVRRIIAKRKMKKQREV